MELIAYLSSLLMEKMTQILDAKSMDIKDVDNKETPFLYSSGWHGPGYVMIKGLVSQIFFKSLLHMLSPKIATKASKVKFLAGNITGGVVPGWILCQALESILGKEIQYVYVGGSRIGESGTVIQVDKVALENCAIQISETVLGSGIDFHFVAGAAPNGMLLGYRLSEILSFRTGRFIPFVYVRDAQKKGGHKEIITGVENNPYISRGSIGIAIGQVDNYSETTLYVEEQLNQHGFKARVPPGASLSKLASINSDFPVSQGSHEQGIVVEELVNFAQTTSTSARILRKMGYTVKDAVAILFYENPKAIETLREMDLSVSYLFTLKELIKLADARRIFPEHLIELYMEYLENPIEWNKKRGFERVESGGTL